MNLRMLTHVFNQGKENCVSEKTISRYLHQMGYWARNACPKPLISATNTSKRLAYYHSYKSWKSNNWGNVIFSDESKFNLHSSDGRIKVWRKKNERYLDECTKKTIKGGPYVMFWGCITSQTMGPLIEVNMNLNSNNYTSLILEPFMKF